MAPTILFILVRGKVSSGYGPVHTPSVPVVRVPVDVYVTCRSSTEKGEVRTPVSSFVLSQCPPNVKSPSLPVCTYLLFYTSLCRLTLVSPHPDDVLPETLLYHPTPTSSSATCRSPFRLERSYTVPVYVNRETSSLPFDNTEGTPHVPRPSFHCSLVRPWIRLPPLPPPGTSWNYSK